MMKRERRLGKRNKPSKGQFKIPVAFLLLEEKIVFDDMAYIPYNVAYIQKLSEGGAL